MRHKCHRQGRIRYAAEHLLDLGRVAVRRDLIRRERLVAFGIMRVQRQ